MDLTEYAGTPTVAHLVFRYNQDLSLKRLLRKTALTYENDGFVIVGGYANSSE